MIRFDQWFSIIVVAGVACLIVYLFYNAHQQRPVTRISVQCQNPDGLSPAFWARSPKVRDYEIIDGGVRVYHREPGSHVDIVNMPCVIVSNSVKQ